MRDWKRYDEAKSLRDAGLTLKEVGAALGVSGSRAREMLETVARRERQLAEEAEDPSLVPWWRGLKNHTVGQLELRGFDSRDACMALAADDLTTYLREKRLSLAIVNEVRGWLGVAPYVPIPRVASTAELERARRLLERHGWRVEPPNAPPSRPAPLRCPGRS
jgi:hypothetical protein